MKPRPANGLLHLLPALLVGFVLATEATFNTPCTVLPQALGPWHLLFPLPGLLHLSSHPLHLCSKATPTHFPATLVAFPSQHHHCVYVCDHTCTYIYTCV
jgi:hypothetical protein